MTLVTLRSDMLKLVAVAIALAFASQTIAQDAATTEAEASAEPAGPTLTVGDKAPQLEIEHWVQQGGMSDEQFEPITDFESGKVYMVEFWATWCGPCIASMPHLSELQDKYRDQGLQIISISDEDLATVEKFLERENPNETNDEGEPLTFDEITSNYFLTVDPDGSAETDYMRAAGENGIPTSFLVGKDGHIEWIGHPMQIDEPLQAVLDDKWDREAYKKELEARKEIERAQQQIIAMVGEGKYDEARQAAAELRDKATGPRIKASIERLLMAIDFNQLQEQVAAGETEAAKSSIETLLGKLGDEPQGKIQLAMMVAQISEQAEVDSSIVDMLIGEVEQMDAASENPLALHSLAMLYRAKGDLTKAVELETQAVEAADGRMKAQLNQMLDQLKAEQESPEEEDAGDEE